MRNYLFAIANFLAAFGGGLIMVKGNNLLERDIFLHGAILASLSGAVIGLLLLQILPNKLAQKISLWFSISGGGTSLILLILFIAFEVNEKIVGNLSLFFFGLLCIRFGFWFYSRVLRVQTSAADSTGIAWVEWGYHIGMACSLAVWGIISIKISMINVFLIDAVLQITAGIIDMLVTPKNKKSDYVPSEKAELSQLHGIIDTREIVPFDYQFYWRLTATLIFFTIGFQAITFSALKQVSHNFGNYILACFYLGVALAAFVYQKLEIQLDWKFSEIKNTSRAVVGSKNLKINFSFISILAWSILIVALVGIIRLDWGKFNLSDGELFRIVNLKFQDCLLLIFIASAAFICEILVLTLIDQIGKNEKLSNRPGMIIKSYGLIATGTTLSLLILSKISNIEIGWLITVGICFVGTNSLVWKRKIK